MYGNTLLDRLDRKFGRYAIRNLMTIIVFGTVFVWLFNSIVYMRTGVWLEAYLYFDKQAILQGQVWRVLTFIFVPSTDNMLFLAISLYFYWLIGNSLENEWGSFKFDVFYLCGVLGSIVFGLITGFATAEYLNMSLFLAFAILYPNYQVLVFFFIPIKMKWLALIDLVGLILLFVLVGWPGKIALLVAFVNIALFFWRGLYYRIKNAFRRRKWKRQTRKPNRRQTRNDSDGDDPFEL